MRYRNYVDNVDNEAIEVFLWLIVGNFNVNTIIIEIIKILLIQAFGFERNVFFQISFKAYYYTTVNYFT